jgi:hypothetical protein
MVAQAYNPSYWGGRDWEDCSPGEPSIKRDLVSKIANTKRASGVTQVVECLPSKQKALSSTASIAPLPNCS